MKEKIKKQEKGITLIALVITIIVLLILAGVAISMLSGENGILTRASEAKETTEEAQKEEAGALFSYELVLNNSKYKYQYGYLTGFEYDNNENHTVETVEDLEKELPDGYKVTSRYQYKVVNRGERSEIEDVKIDDKTINIATGMAITKNGEEVARTVLFGDVNMDGTVNNSDTTFLRKYIGFLGLSEMYEVTEDCQKIAANVYNDRELNSLDVNVITEAILNGTEINQNNELLGRKLKRVSTEIQEYISLLDKDTGYSFEYNEEDDTYTLKGVKKGTTVKELVDKLPNQNKVKIYYIETMKSTEMSNDDELKENCYVEISFSYMLSNGNEMEFTPKFAKIELN